MEGSGWGMGMGMGDGGKGLENESTVVNDDQKKTTKASMKSHLELGGNTEQINFPESALLNFEELCLEARTHTDIPRTFLLVLVACCWS